MNKNKSYSGTYDAYYDGDKNIWLEKKCSDDDCEFCKDRPETPNNPFENEYMLIYASIVRAILEHGEERQTSRKGRTKAINYRQLHASLKVFNFDNMYKEDGSSNVKARTKSTLKQLKQDAKIDYRKDFIWIAEEK